MVRLNFWMCYNITIRLQDLLSKKIDEQVKAHRSWVGFVVIFLQFNFGHYLFKSI